MTNWTIVLWSDAKQVAEQAGLRKQNWPTKNMSPQDFFQNLRSEKQLDLAAAFISCALPRLETIAWVTEMLPKIRKGHPDFRERRLLRDMTRRWIDDPDDRGRRDIFDIADRSDPEWPETLLGLAVFFSGGSIAPPDLPPVLPEGNIASNLAAAALQSAAIEHAETDEGFLDRALDLAHKVAVNGRESLRS